MIRWSSSLLLVPLLLTGGLAPAAAQVPDQPALKPEMRLGSHLLRALLHQMNITSLGNFADIGDPRDVLLISIGDPATVQQVPGGLFDFVQRGGGLLVATDHSFRDPVKGRERLIGAHVVDTPIVCLDPAPSAVYDDKPELPILLLDELKPVYFSGKVATSLPARLDVGRYPEAVFAFLPARCVTKADFERRGNWAQEIVDGQRAFGTAMTHGNGRVVLLADAHIFINDLMARDDLDNYDFAGAVLQYLADGGKRKRCLFIENGQIVTKFDVPLQDLSELPWEAIRRGILALENKLATMESRGEIHNRFWDFLQRHNISPAKLAAVTLVVLTILGGLYLLHRVMKSRYASETGLPRLATSLGAQVPTVGLVPQRLEEQRSAGRLHEPGRHLARAMFLAVGCTPSPTPPRVTIAGGWWHRWSVGARFRRIWLLAFGTKTVPVRARQWPGLVHDIQSLRQAFLDDEIQLESRRVDSPP
jgi:hypothetical protein